MYHAVMLMGNTDAERVDAALGIRLRELRRERNLTAREVAKRAGVSAAYLSRLENGKVSPTVATLTRIVKAIGESIGALFRDGADGPLVRRDGRRRVSNRGVADYLITPGTATRLEVLETVIEPGAGSGEQAYTHAGDEECVLILAGGLRLWVDEELYDLRVGDAVTFACRAPHRWRNCSATETRALWIITPAGY
jgi:transcriptional regulator with XRE-family HTH domain